MTTSVHCYGEVGRDCCFLGEVLEKYDGVAEFAIWRRICRAKMRQSLLFARWKCAASCGPAVVKETLAQQKRGGNRGKIEKTAEEVAMPGPKQGVEQSNTGDKRSRIISSRHVG